MPSVRTSSRPLRAMVMAAGAGTRLRPLTYTLPKPMVPIANRPVLEYTLENLKRHGISEIVMNLHAYPQMIRDHFGNGSRFGMKIEYSHEPTLLGTAGGVKKVASFLEKGTFLVMSGDGLTDANLTQLVEFHRARRSVATMALKAVDSRFEYGVTMTAPNGRITEFVEKPLWSDVFSNQVNTGIYVFEPEVLKVIPKGKFFDFGQNVWPALLKTKKPIYGFPLDSYWCDVGNLQEYRKAHKDFLAGQITLNRSSQPRGQKGLCGKGTQVAKGAKIEAGSLIGEDCDLSAGATIGPSTVLGDRVRVGRGAVVRNCVVWNDVRIEPGANLENCIIGHGAQVTAGTTISDGNLIRQ